MNKSDTYCPYELVFDPAQFDLKAAFLHSAFGKLYVVHSGRRSDRVTLFLHGVGGTWASWTPLLQAARDTDINLGDIILVDLPGFGSSENNLDHLKASIVGSELLRIVQNFGWTQVDIVGHSMGGFLALDIAAVDNPTIRSVSVISGTYLSVIESIRHPFKTLLHQPKTSIVYALLVMSSKLGPVTGWMLHRIKYNRFFIKSLAKTYAHPQLLMRSILDGIADNTRPKSFALAAQNGRNHASILEWNKITVPFKALFGATDQLVSVSDMQRLQASLGNMWATCLEDTGHFAHLERPYTTLEWLAGSDQPGKKDLA